MDGGSEYSTYADPKSTVPGLKRSFTGSWRDDEGPEELCLSMSLASSLPASTSYINTTAARDHQVIRNRKSCIGTPIKSYMGKRSYLQMDSWDDKSDVRRCHRFDPWQRRF